MHIFYLSQNMSAFTRYDIKHALNESPIDQDIVIDGFVQFKRSAKKGELYFLELYDGSIFTDLQIVVPSSAVGFEEVPHLGLYSSVTVMGTLIKCPPHVKQDVELQVKEIVVHNNITDKEFPLQKCEFTYEFLRKFPHLRCRTKVFRAIMTIRSKLAHATHCFFQDNDYAYVHTPIITDSDCEGAGEMFQVTTKLGQTPYKPEEDFFARRTFLTVSGQIELEPFIFGLGKTYTFGPTFRAEDSNTARHLAEFWMIEPEIAFATRDMTMDVAEAYTKHCIAYIMDHCALELEYMAERSDGLLDRLTTTRDSAYFRVSYTQAIEDLLQAISDGHSFEFPVEWGIDLASEHEKWLVSHYGGPTFIFDYPKEIKSFYMKLNDDGKTVAAFDLLIPGIGELIGGSQREDDLERLESAMETKGLDPADYTRYLDLRRYGSCVHSGFGLGFERLIMYCTGVENIRDTIPYTRYPRHC